MRGGEKEGTRFSKILSIEYMALVSTTLTKIKDKNQYKDNEVVHVLVYTRSVEEKLRVRNTKYINHYIHAGSQYRTITYVHIKRGP